MVSRIWNNRVEVIGSAVTGATVSINDVLAERNSVRETNRDELGGQGAPGVREIAA